jgi:hypothetical protein
MARQIGDAGACDQLQGGGDGDRLNGHQSDEHEQLHRACGDGVGSAEQHADERAGQCDQPDRSGLVEPRNERL